VSSIDVRYDDDPATTLTEPWPGRGDEVVVLHKVSFGHSEGFRGQLEFLATESS